ERRGDLGGPQRGPHLRQTGRGRHPAPGRARRGGRRPYGRDGETPLPRQAGPDAAEPEAGAPDPRGAPRRAAGRGLQRLGRRDGRERHHARRRPARPAGRYHA
ncbi:MAG: MOSC domain protein, partial [uncultured Rubrobacteraceae bacterium]